jgi:predicted lipid-binding transport protein (Tim44 family)
MAEVTVRFVSELVNATRDKAGQLIAGNPNAVEETIDIWTFARNLRSSDPNWQLIGTATPA